MGKAIGIYGGTFDPIHFGHLNLAIEILEQRNLDEVWFCPAYISPHKLNEKPTLSAHRLRMLELATEDEPRFRILETEIQRQTPSYTIDTVQEILATQSNRLDPDHFSLILSDETLPGFFYWRQPEEIVKLIPLLIGSRSLFFSVDELKGDPAILEAIDKGLTQTRVMEISSTDVRERLAHGLYCSHLVPTKVLDYIRSHGLYSTI